MDGPFKDRSSNTGEETAEDISDLRKLLQKATDSERDLSEKNEFLRSMLDCVPANIAVVNSSGEIIYVNKSWAEFGRENEAPSRDTISIGVNYFNVCSEAEGEGSALAIEALNGMISVRNGDIDRFLLEYPCNSPQEQRWFLMYATPLRFKGEKHLIIMHVNITERKLIEQEKDAVLHSLNERVKELSLLYRTQAILQEQKPVDELLQEIVTIIPSGWQYPETTMARITLENTQYTTPVFYTTQWTQKAYFSTYDGRNGEIEVAYGIEKPRSYEGPFLKEERDLINALAGLISEFLNRRNAQETRSRLASIVDSSSDAIIGKTLEGIITSWNAGAEKIFGYGADEAIGRPISIIAPPDHIDEQEQILEKISRGEITDHLETVRIRKDGKKIFVSLTVSPIKDDSGKIIGASTISRDVTGKVRIQRELENARNQSDLYLDLISHDINNMNQTGLGYLEIVLSSGMLDPDTREMLMKPYQAMKSSSKLIENIRKLQKIKSGDSQLKETRLCEVLLDLKRHYSNIHGRNVTINFVRVPECLILANELVRDVFSNIISNSIKHSDPDKPLIIDMRVDTVTEDGKEYRKVSIEDNGPGIRDEIKPGLFARFQRGDTSAAGTGLGLYLVKMLVESFGGKIWVEDRVPGDYTKGAMFVVMLPSA